MSVQECTRLAKEYFGSEDVVIRYREERDLDETKERLIRMRVWAIAFLHEPGNPTSKTGTGVNAKEPATFECKPPAVLGVGMHIRKEIEVMALSDLARTLRDALAERMHEQGAVEQSAPEP
jgi:hypothetical protein